MGNAEQVGHGVELILRYAQSMEFEAAARYAREGVQLNGVAWDEARMAALDVLGRRWTATRELAPGQVREDQGWLYGQVVYNSRGRPAFSDHAAQAGQQVDEERQATARADYNAVVIEEYREARARVTAEQRAEEMAEMRAAFGPGERVVNVLTGETTQL